MDVSTLFRACVKTVSLRKEALTEDPPRPPPRRQKQESHFRNKTRSLVTQISKLRQLLMDNRSAYLNLSKHLALNNPMTDGKRDEIDNIAQEIMTKCSSLIKNLERETAQSGIGNQNREHRMTMLELIKHYLENVCKIYSEQRAIRYKKMMELKKLSKLEIESTSEDLINLQRKELDTDKRDSSPSSPFKVQEINGDVSSMVYEEEPSVEDIQIFESENEQLYNELNTITEEVRLIESKVVHIAELQEIFTEKVLQQDRDLDKLVTTIVGSTENVKEANEQIRQAIQRNAGLRVWILFFLLVMSFSLLFLDWYNP